MSQQLVNQSHSLRQTVTAKKPTNKQWDIMYWLLTTWTWLGTSLTLLSTWPIPTTLWLEKRTVVFTMRGPGCIRTGSLSPGLCGPDKPADSHGSTELSSDEQDLVWEPPAHTGSGPSCWTGPWIKTTIYKSKINYSHRLYSNPLVLENLLRTTSGANMEVQRRDYKYTTNREIQLHLYSILIWRELQQKNTVREQ